MPNTGLVLEVTEYRKLEKLVKIKRRSKGSIIREALMEYLEKPEIKALLKGKK